MKIREFILEGKQRLRQAPVQCADPLLHMKQMVEHVLGWTSAELYLHWEDELPEAARSKLESLLERRMTGEPFQYLTGYEWFWESRFHVGPGVLIPRRETELLLETLLAEGKSGWRVAELGAGSGNIGISALLERPDWTWHAFEINPDSLPYLETNRQTLLSQDSAYHIHHGDFFALAAATAPYDAVVANPPYVAQQTIAGLAPEVRREPLVALDGGDDGLEVLSRLIQEAPAWLCPGAPLIVEIGSDQGEAVLALARQGALENARLLRDYSGLARVVVGRKG
jgi:release factor glutamine methyltransferase